MVSGKRIIEAFTSSHFEFKVTRFNWTKEFYPSLTDLSFNFIYNGKKFTGRGTDSSEELALIKAAMESIERCVCSYHKIHTNGVAAHFDFNLAKGNARNELIERDAALCHYLTQKPMLVVKTSGTPIQTPIEEFEKLGIKFKFFKMIQIEKIIPILALAKGTNSSKPFGLILGLGAKETLNESLYASFIECARNVSFALKTPKLETFGLSDFNNAESVPYSHFKFALNSHTPILLEAFLNNTSENENNKLLDNSNFQFETLDVSFLKLKIDKFFVVKAINSQLQNMFYGSTIPEKINMVRLSEFAGKNITFENVFKIPHIFG